MPGHGLSSHLCLEWVFPSSWHFIKLLKKLHILESNKGLCQKQSKSPERNSGHLVDSESFPLWIQKEEELVTGVSCGCFPFWCLGVGCRSLGPLHLYLLMIHLTLVICISNYEKWDFIKHLLREHSLSHVPQINSGWISTVSMVWVCVPQCVWVQSGGY